MKQKFKTRTLIVEAEQFIFKNQHAFFDNSEPTNMPDGVYKKRFEDYQDDKPYYKYGIDTKKGFEELNDKDWVLTDEKENQTVMSDKKFKRKYELISN